MSTCVRCGIVFAGLGLSLLGCSPSNREPVYEGKSLTQWAAETEDQTIDYQPSASAQQAKQALLAIGPSNAVPFLMRGLQASKPHPHFPEGFLECFKIYGPEAKAAIPVLSDILNQPARAMDQDSAQIEAAESLSYLGPDAVPILLSAATHFEGQPLQYMIIEDLANFGTNGAAAKPAILNWSRDPDSQVRLGALHTYVAIEEDKQVVVSFLFNAMKDSDNLVRRDAEDFLKEIDPGALARSNNQAH
jgi:hypothetical protein